VARLLPPADTRPEAVDPAPAPKLDGGKIEKLVGFLRAIEASPHLYSGTIRIEAGVFERNTTAYALSGVPAQHLFVGSGVIEAAANRHGSRLKQSGMFWTVRGANSIIALRCCHLERALRGLLGIAPDRLISTFMSTPSAHVPKETGTSPRSRGSFPWCPINRVLIWRDDPVSHTPPHLPHGSDPSIRRTPDEHDWPQRPSRGILSAASLFQSAKLQIQVLVERRHPRITDFIATTPCIKGTFCGHTFANEKWP